VRYADTKIRTEQNEAIKASKIKRAVNQKQRRHFHFVWQAICTVYISPEATKQVKKSRSGHKLHKSKSGEWGL